ncbi:hypothetical protein QYF36_024063 [Acer negundo]|nr:hypothetical protein QYF36_024063 [Acer negundo]
MYMEIPSGFETGSNANNVYKLRKSLYGFKQSARAWFDRFTKAIKKHGYSQEQADHTLFTKFSPTGQVAILIVYVDDIIVTGINAARSKKGIVVSQRKYILDLLKEIGMLGCKPADTPMESSYKIGFKGDSPPVDTRRYQRLRLSKLTDIVSIASCLKTRHFLFQITIEEDIFQVQLMKIPV